MSKRKSSSRGRGGRKGGIKGFLASGVVLLLLGGGLMSIVQSNNLKSPTDVFTYFKGWSDNIWDCGAGDLEWNCDLPKGEGGGSGGSGSSEKDKGGSTGNNSDKLPPEGSNTDYAGGSQGAKLVTLDKLDKLSVGDAQIVDYKRSEWKHWTGSPCNTRETVLKNSGKDVKNDKDCRALSGTWVEPYDNKTVTDASQLDIDHVIPLGYAATHGGQSWSPAKKEQFANDLTQLLATDAGENRSKSDKGPGKYMPPNKAYHCEYAKIWVNTASKYNITIEENDKVKLKAALQKCSN